MNQMFVASQKIPEIVMITLSNILTIQLKVIADNSTMVDVVEMEIVSIRKRNVSQFA